MRADPLFDKPLLTPSVQDQKALTFRRVKRLYEYDFLPDVS